MGRENTHASIEVVPPGPTPTLMQEREINCSLVGTGYFAAIVNIEQNVLGVGGEMGFALVDEGLK